MKVKLFLGIRQILHLQANQLLLPATGMRIAATSANPLAMGLVM